MKRMKANHTAFKIVQIYEIYETESQFEVELGQTATF